VEGSEVSADVTTEEPVEVLLTVPRSSFDLLEGAAEDKGRSRVLNAALLVLAVLVVCTLASRGVLMRLDASGNRDRATALDEESAEITAELAARRRSGEVSRQAVLAHIEERLAIVKDATASEIAYARIIREVSSLGQGITVNSIVFGGSNKSSTSSSSASTSDKTTTKKAASKSSVITVAGTATDTATANAATSALSDPSKFPYLATGDPGSVNCGGKSDNVCSWTWNGTITDEGWTGRASEIAERVNPLVKGSEGGGN
jgi:hypothetical protein